MPSPCLIPCLIRNRYDLAKVGRYKYNKKLGLSNRIIGCVAAEDIIDPNTGEILAEKTPKITREVGFQIENSGVKHVLVYSKTEDGHVSKVIGNNFVSLAEYVDFSLKVLKLRIRYTILS